MKRLATIVGNWRPMLLVATAAGVVLSYWYCAHQIERLAAAAENLQTCQQLATDIGEATKSPRRARLETRSLDDLGTAVEKAAADAQLAPDRVLRVDPQAARRIAKTDYLEQTTEVELLAVTLRQIVEFLFNVSHTENELQVSTLRLRLPHETSDSTTQELWLADIVLTQRIYAPTTAGR